jgi:hypothetical protein
LVWTNEKEYNNEIKDSRREVTQIEETAKSFKIDSRLLPNEKQSTFYILEIRHYDL